jgi:hypothetical protein
VTGDTFWSQQGEGHPLGGCLDITGRAITDRTMGNIRASAFDALLGPQPPVDPVYFESSLPHNVASFQFLGGNDKDLESGGSVASRLSLGSGIVTASSPQPASCSFSSSPPPLHTSREQMLETRRAADRERCSGHLDAYAAREDPLAASSTFPTRRATRRLVSKPIDND